MNILVTGATGFVGSVLVPRLMDSKGVGSISVLVLPGEEIPVSWRSAGIRAIFGDIKDRDTIAGICPRHSHVIHLAGLISYAKRDAKRLKEVNVDGVRNIVEAALLSGVERLIHVSSVGAIGFFKNGRPADETVPFNWPPAFHYMTSKYEGQQIVERAISKHGLNALVLNPASIMGPGDPNFNSPHNQLYARIYQNRIFGSFSGGLAVVDVRDVSAIILKALERGRAGEKYLLVGANKAYAEILRAIAGPAGRKVHPFRVSPGLIMAMGWVAEQWSRVTGKNALLTYSYGRLSGWKTYYSAEKSRREFSHEYMDFDTTVRDSCAYFEKTFADRLPLPGRKR